MQRLIGLIRSPRFYTFLGLLLTFIMLVSLLPNEVLAQNIHFDWKLPNSLLNQATSANTTTPITSPAVTPKPTATPTPTPTPTATPTPSPTPVAPPNPDLLPLAVSANSTLARTPNPVTAWIKYPGQSRLMPARTWTTKSGLLRIKLI